MHPQHIGRGNTVAFETPEGPQRGTVKETLLDVSNGRRIAVIDVPGTMEGRPWLMPVSDLQLAPATTH